MNRKEKILQKALELFNKQGVESITTRHIAKEINISQGNLHYHFPNKEVIMQKLYDEFKKEVSEASHYTKKQADFDLNDLWSSKVMNFRIMIKYSFLFTDRANIGRRIPNIKTETDLFIKIKKKQLLEIITLFQSKNIFVSDIPTTIIESFVDGYIISTSSWLDAIDLIENKEDLPEYYAKITFNNWYQYLTDEGKKLHQSIIHQIK